MSYQEIGDTTPIELDELVNQYVTVRDDDNQRFGLICSTLCNLKRDPDKKAEPFQPSDFFPLHNQQEIIEEEPIIDNRGEILDDFWMMLKSRQRMKKARLDKARGNK